MQKKEETRLIPYEDRNLRIYEPKEFVENAILKLNATELKLFFYIASQIDRKREPKLIGDTDVTVNGTRFLRMAGVSPGGRNFEIMKGTLERLNSSGEIFEYVDDLGNPHIKGTSFIHSWDINAGTRDIKVRIDEEFYKYFMAVPEPESRALQYTMVFKSKFSILLYRYIRTAKRGEEAFDLSVEEFCRIIECSYDSFGDVKRRALDPAVEEISEQSDIVVGYSLERSGRKVDRIRFSVKEKMTLDFLDESDYMSRSEILDGIKKNILETKEFSERYRKADPEVFRMALRMLCGWDRRKELFSGAEYEMYNDVLDKLRQMCTASRPMKINGAEVTPSDVFEQISTNIYVQLSKSQDQVRSLDAGVLVPVIRSMIARYGEVLKKDASGERKIKDKSKYLRSVIYNELSSSHYEAPQAPKYSDADIAEEVRRLYEKDMQQSRAEFEAKQQEIAQRLPEIAQMKEDLKAQSAKMAAEVFTGNFTKVRAEVENLRKRMIKRLEEAGYEKADLDIQYRCPVCKDTGKTDEGIRCGCYARKKEEAVRILCSR